MMGLEPMTFCMASAEGRVRMGARARERVADRVRRDRRPLLVVQPGPLLRRLQPAIRTLSWPSGVPPRTRRPDRRGRRTATRAGAPRAAAQAAETARPN